MKIYNQALLWFKHTHRLREQRKKRVYSAGFTIIEVLIVLAIAGLVMLVIFIAVPNLQRNARNNARKQDASRIASSIAEYISLNNNRLPGIVGSNIDELRWLSDCQKISDVVGLLNQFGTDGALSSWCEQNQNSGGSYQTFVNDFTYRGIVYNGLGEVGWLTYTVFSKCKQESFNVDSSLPGGGVSGDVLDIGTRRQSVLLYPLEIGGTKSVVMCIQVT